MRGREVGSWVGWFSYQCGAWQTFRLRINRTTRISFHLIAILLDSWDNCISVVDSFYRSGSLTRPPPTFKGTVQPVLNVLKLKLLERPLKPHGTRQIVNFQLNFIAVQDRPLKELWTTICPIILSTWCDDCAFRPKRRVQSPDLYSSRARLRSLGHR